MTGKWSCWLEVFKNWTVYWLSFANLSYGHQNEI